MYSACTAHVQCMYSSCTVHVQCMYSACTVSVQHRYSACTMSVHHRYSECTVHVQCMYSVTRDLIHVTLSYVMPYSVMYCSTEYCCTRASSLHRVSIRSNGAAPPYTCRASAWRSWRPPFVAVHDRVKACVQGRNVDVGTTEEFQFG